jgi:asparagine synthase (glutamine-hydrolysing)
MFDHLRGMYAFALWDNLEKKLLIARDPYGIKPLYYADNGETISVASSVKALLKSKQISQCYSAAGIVGFLSWGSVPEPFTFYEDIKQLPAGNYLEICDGKVKAPISFYSISKQFISSKSTENVVKEIRSSLLESVSYHLIADVPVGLFLSAGIDSSVLLSLAQEAGAADLQTLTLSFEEFSGTEQDEELIARKFSQEMGVRHVNRVVTRKEFQEDLPLILQAMDQPTLDGINTYFICKAAKENGIKVALSGLGGDELFGGYPSFKVLPRWVKLAKCFAQIPGMEFVFRGFVTLCLKGSPKAAFFLNYGADMTGAYYLKRGLFMPSEIKKLLGEEVSERGFKELKIHQSLRDILNPAPLNDYGTIAVLESCQYMRNQLLRDADWAGMTHSVEIRTPLVDAFMLKDLAPILNTVSGEHRKQLLSQTPQKMLPDYITGRKKTGFGLPMKNWLLQIQKNKNEHWSRAWAKEILKSFNLKELQCAS